VLGGDITLVKGELGGAGFRVALPAAQDSPSGRSERTGPTASQAIAPQSDPLGPDGAHA